MTLQDYVNKYHGHHVGYGQYLINARMVLIEKETGLQFVKKPGAGKKLVTSEIRFDCVCDGKMIIKPLCC